MRPADIAVSSLIQCIDLTSLNSDDTPAKIQALCEQAVTPYGAVAAVCLYPPFVSQASQALMATGVRVATVANFPEGKTDMAPVATEIQAAILAGAAEIDIVLPYSYYQKESAELRQKACEFLATCRKYGGKNIILKMILETGALTPTQIQQASEDAIEYGADFLKTSTGKISTGATPEACKIMLAAIQNSGKPVGFKASGGIRTLDDALTYAKLVQDYLGQEALHPSRFRLGASSLLEVLINHMRNSL